MNAGLEYLVLLVIILSNLLIIYLAFYEIPRLKKRVVVLAKAEAQKIARTDWMVKDCEFFEDHTGLLVRANLELQSLDWRKKMAIDFRLPHPSLETIKCLERYDVINLRFVERPVAHLLDCELCAYLLVEPAS